MIREKSCGAVVYYEAAGERLYLLEEMRAGHYSMPKGHVEPGESEAETAEREIGEETGLAVTADTGFRACESYGLTPLAGMELTTAEDIHLVCLLRTLPGI